MRIESLTNDVRSEFGKRIIYLTNEGTAEQLIKNALQSTPSNTTVIRDREALQAEIGKRRYGKFVGQHFQALGAAARAIATAPVAEYDGFSFSLGGLASVDKQASSVPLSERRYVIYEDGIEPKEFGRFLSFFSKCDHMSMPTVVLVADRHMEGLTRKLAHAGGHFQFRERYPGRDATETKVRASSVLSLADLLEEIAANNFLSVSCVDFKIDNPAGGDFSDLAKEISGLYAQVKAISFEYDKFRAKPLVAKGLEALRGVDRGKLNANQCKIYDVLDILLILTDLYSTEQHTERLDYAVSLAEGLNSEVLKAQCYRLVNLNAGYGKISDHFLKASETAFRKADQNIMALFSQNNRLLNQLHGEGQATDGFKSLITELEGLAPMSFSLAQMLSNAMVASLLDTRLNDALRFEEQAERYNALPIHRLGIKTNTQICRFQQGEALDDEELDKLLFQMTRYRLDDFYAYHQTVIAFNVLEMKKQSGLPTASAEDFLRRGQFFDYESVISGGRAPADFLLDIMPTTRVTKAYRGQRGAFIDRTRLIPIIHFAWM